MGAIEKTATITGRNLQEAFRKLQEEDREEHGNDIYSGGWNNCQGVREVSTKEFDKTEDISKHEPAIAKCVLKPIENKMKVKTSVKNFPNTGTRKWVTKYIVVNREGYKIISELKQTEAIKKARAYVEKNPDEKVTVHITKSLVSDTKVAEISYKKSSTERDGTWEIFGCMPY